jgi:hypothetical protein
MMHNIYEVMKGKFWLRELIKISIQYEGKVTKMET